MKGSSGQTPQVLSFTPVVAGVFNVTGAGAPQFTDTDVSATTGTTQHRLWLIAAFPTGGNEVGARPHGSAVDCHVNIGLRACTLVSGVDTAGHMDLFDAAGGATCVYTIFGYIEVG